MWCTFFLFLHPEDETDFPPRVRQVARMGRRRQRQRQRIPPWLTHEENDRDVRRGPWRASIRGPAPVTPPTVTRMILVLAKLRYELDVRARPTPEAACASFSPSGPARTRTASARPSMSGGETKTTTMMAANAPQHTSARRTDGIWSGGDSLARSRPGVCMAAAGGEENPGV